MKIHKLLGSALAAYLWFGCVSQIDSRPFAGTLPDGSTLDLAGSFALSPSGELTLALRQGCTSVRFDTDTHKEREVPCGKAVRDAIRVIASTPWHSEVRGTWIDGRHLVFHVDWATAPLRVLAEDASTEAMRPWLVSGSEWHPTREDAEQMLHLVGAATGTETEVVQGGESPRLEIKSFELAGGGLRAGGHNTLVVRMINRGPGIAYRVAATTRSSMPALHGRRLEFGSIQPGAEKVRQVELEVASGETTPDAMVVLVVAEGNGFAPASVSRRWPVAVAEPELAAQCVIPEHHAPRPEVSAGEHITLRCVVSNTGVGAANVVVETSINGAAALRSRPQDVPAAGRAAFSTPLVVPRELAVGSTVQLAIVARDTRLGRTTQAAVSATVRKPKLCEEGKLTRKQYDAKINELRATVTAGDMTQAQLDRYDAELILCLQ